MEPCIFEIEYDGRLIAVQLAAGAEMRGMGRITPIADPAEAVRDALNAPIGAPPLAACARSRIDVRPDATAVIVVSDNTRPVPYAGDDGILLPVLDILANAGFANSNITVLVGNGSHRAMRDDEIAVMLGRDAVRRGVAIVNHRCDDHGELRCCGTTARGSVVWINRRYMDADLRIVTGLVESHFIAGASGGRKGICPAIVGRETLEVFHGAELLASPLADDLILAGNPCSEESLAVAQMVGCDFLVNVTLDSDKRLTGVYCGDMVTAHEAAVEKIREYVAVPLEKPYDIVVVPGGHVAVNHYQSAKAATQASRAVKRGGRVILYAKHTDPDVVGGADYKACLRLCAQHGSAGFVSMLHTPGWEFIHEQWQVQLWCRALDRMGGPEHYVHCSLETGSELFELLLPGRCGQEFLGEADRSLPSAAQMKAMVERSVADSVDRARRSGIEHPSLLLLTDGPYGIVQCSV